MREPSEEISTMQAVIYLVVFLAVFFLVLPWIIPLLDWFLDAVFGSYYEWVWQFFPRAQ